MPPDSLFDGFILAGVRWRPARPLVLRPGTYRLLCELTERVALLVLAACRRRASTAGELRAALGVPAEQVPMLDPGEPVGEHLLVAMRPDIVTESGVPKFLELNIDGAVGVGGHVDFLGSRFADFYEQLSGAGAGQPGVSAPPSVLDVRSAAIRSFLRLPAGAHVVIPAFQVGALPGMEDIEAFAKVQETACESGRRHGLDVTVFPLSRLATGPGERLLADGRAVDGVLRLFDSFSQPHSTGLDALIRAVRAGTVAMFTPEATILLTSKVPFTWLWDDIDLLSRPDQDLVRRHVPWTARLETVRTADAIARRPSLVLKPAEGYGGTGVVLGPAVTAGRWRQELDRAADAGHYVLQEHVACDTVALPFVDAGDGELRMASVPFVFGPFVFGRRPAGVLVRHGTPGSGADPVLNVMQGAFPNAALVSQEDAGAADL